MPLYALTIFTGAFLLFLVQPLIGKYILPWFGGGTGVWTTCLLFFQLLLLGGYAYAHFTSRWLKPRVQVILHLVLLGGALALLPITPAEAWKPDPGGNPTLQILGLLAMSLGLPYFVLSATGPLLQHWFSRTHPGVSPYRLYALSNVGSLLALISFPFFFEIHFTRTIQASLWGWGLAAYVLGCGSCAIKFLRRPQMEAPGSPVKADRGDQAAAPSWSTRFFWLLLPACASVLLLATTNKICQEVAVIPFLWVLPLGCYLLSFILCFDHSRWYVRRLFGPALIATLGGIAWLWFTGQTISIYGQGAIYLAGMFICCMVCHGELYRLKPVPRQLTEFYLMIAAGGALGGIFVALIAPMIFNDYLELHWGLLLCGLIFVLCCGRTPNSGRFRRWQLLTCIGVGVALAGLSMGLWKEAHSLGGSGRQQSRNFYGVLKVLRYDQGPTESRYLELYHGATLHGRQFTDRSRAMWPTTYYAENSGIGLALRTLPAGQRRIGIVGLGAGTLATYAQAGDLVHFYEINPEVKRLATESFTFLSNCPANIEITLGDARLALEQEPPQRFDLIVLDAFSSDAIPVHLLTKEAFESYERHLTTNGTIAVHVSNHYLNLEPVVVNLARHFNFNVSTIDYIPTPDKWWIAPSVWMLLSRNEGILESTVIRDAARPPMTNSVTIPLWTDDFASLGQILRLDRIPEINPTFSEAQIQIASGLCRQGNFSGAANHYRQMLKTHPVMVDLLNNLAWLLATCPDAAVRNGSEAVEHAEKACQLTHYQTTVVVGTLAAAYAEAGRFEDAIRTAQKACAQAAGAGDEILLQKNRQLLGWYQKGSPYHEGAEPPAGLIK